MTVTVIFFARALWTWSFAVLPGNPFRFEGFTFCNSGIANVRDTGPPTGPRATGIVPDPDCVRSNSTVGWQPRRRRDDSSAARRIRRTYRRNRRMTYSVTVR